MSRKENMKKFKLDVICEKMLIPFGTPVLKILKQTKVTPNQITFIGFFLALISSYFFFKGEFIIAAVIFWLSAICDNVDGRLAREKSMETYKGAWLDSVLDSISEFTIISSIGLGLFIRTFDITYLYITLGAVFFQFMYTFRNAAFIEFFIIKGKKKVKKIVGEKASFFSYCRSVFIVTIPLFSFLSLFFDAFKFLFTLFSTLGILYIAILLYVDWKKFTLAEKKNVLAVRDTR